MGMPKPLMTRCGGVTEATGLPPVLVCHSMGGLAAWPGCAPAADARVHRVLTLGTPHAGTWLARFSHTENGCQMRMNSAWLQALVQEPPSRAKRLCAGIPTATTSCSPPRWRLCQGRSTGW